MKRICIFLGLLALPLLTHAIQRSTLVSKCSSLNGLKKEQLKTAVYNLMNKNMNTLQGNFTVLNYGNGNNSTWWGFYKTDRIASTNECINRYSSKKFYFGSTNTGQVVSGMNIEHSFPKSWWGGSNNYAYKDLFNLYPSDASANSDKSNYPMGVVQSVTSQEIGYDKIGKGTIDGQPNQWCWEPGDQYKGDFSRAYMYMATTYQNLTWSGTQGLQQLEKGSWPTLKEWAYTLYLQWVRNDPVSELEIQRNEAVYGIQKNRNLFVDYPYLAEYIWGDSINVPFNPATSITTAAGDNRYTGHDIPVDIVEAPVFTPAGGTYSTAQTVTISCATPNVTIYYTTDGSEPTDNGLVYEGAITVDESMTLKAVAINDDGVSSSVSTAAYVIKTNSGGSEIEIFVETFDLCDGTGGNSEGFSGSVASSADNFKPDNEGWTASKKFGGYKCARFGTSTAGTGTVTTPSFNIDGETTFSFKAAPWGTDGTALTLSVNGNAKLSETTSETTLTMKAGEWTTYTLTLTGSGSVTVTFTPEKRFFLDDVCVTSVTSPILLPGDVNKDGSISLGDVMALVDIILNEIQSSTEYDLVAADLDGDGQRSLTDIMLLVAIILEQ